jgi:dipeptidase E
MLARRAQRGHSVLVTGYVVAIGGLSMDHDDTALNRFIVGLVDERLPRVCFVPVASGDNDDYIAKFYEQFPASICRPTYLSLLRSVPLDPAVVLSDQDIIYLGGGSTPILLAALRAHGLDAVLREAWERGAVLCGDSAGSHVWFEGCVTNSFGPHLTVLADGLGFLPGSNCAHFDRPDYRSAFEEAIRVGRLTPGTAADDGVALVWRGLTLVEVVGSRPTGDGYRVSVEKGTVNRETIVARRLSS